MEDMEDSVKVLSLFDGGDVGGFLDNANEMLIARGTGAVDARVDVCDVVTNGQRRVLTSRTAVARASASSSLERRM
jgi:hypothetical protein